MVIKDAKVIINYLTEDGTKLKEPAEMTGYKIGDSYSVNAENIENYITLRNSGNTSGILNLGTIEITNTETPDTYVIKETTAPKGYNKFEGSIELSVAKKVENGIYVIDTENTTMVVKNSEGVEITQDIPVEINKGTGRITIAVDNEKQELPILGTVTMV